MPANDSDLTVAVTGPTGTFGFGLMPLLQADDRVSKIVGIARRPFDPAEHGWSKMEYRQGDVRDPDALEQAFSGADVVVHLAFLITGNASKEATRAINVEGTINAFRGAAAAGATRFVYASSVAAYGFHADNPTGMDEDWPTRPADRLFYAQEKAELEALLGQQRVLADQVALGTLTVRLAEEHVAPVESAASPAGFADGFSTGWGVLVDGGRALLAAIGFTIPLAVPAGVVLGAILLWQRRRRRVTPATEGTF